MGFRLSDIKFTYITFDDKFPSKTFKKKQNQVQVCKIRLHDSNRRIKKKYVRIQTVE
jgi:hypothetical protein